VRGHKGALKVSSQVGRGTTFRVLLPAQAVRPAPVESTPARAGDFRGGGLILVVDDEESVRALATHILQRAGFEVVTASNGREAVEVYAGRRRDVRLVLLDMTMPHMDGEATFRALRELDPEAQIVVSSGYSKQEVAAQFAGQGLAGFVQKPYKTDDLLGKVRDLLR